MFRSIYVIVMDSVGVGALPDAYKFSDDGADTFGHVTEGEDVSRIDMLLKLGMSNFLSKNMQLQTDYPLIGVWGKMREVSAGKDTVTGHWELMGLVTEKPMPVYPNGFPKSIIERFERETGHGVIGNKVASGTEIIAELGEEHCRTGKLIVYTSADSVFQIAAHKDVVPLEELYRCCRIAREIMTGENACGRIIARPFEGQAPNFTRTADRKDFSLKPPQKTLLDILNDNGIATTAVGKIDDIFGSRGISDAIRSHGNKECIDATLSLIKQKREGFVFVNLVDFDMLYGHRNDKKGYFEALAYFNAKLKEIISCADNEDCIIITADHGCDPTDASTDHSREYVPVLVYANGIEPASVGTRETFCDLAATLADLFDIDCKIKGNSFADSIKIKNTGIKCL